MMEQVRLTKKKLKLILYLIVLIAILVSVKSLEFTNNPQITPSSAYTDDDLVCNWNVSADTTQVNVSWYRDDILFSSTITVENQSTISSVNTTKNQDWICNITIKNATDNLSLTDSVSIQNSAPTPPKVYDWNTAEIGSSIDLNEDEIYSLDINSSDIDNDNLLYTLISNSSSFCTVTNSATGAVSCSPTTDDLDSINTAGHHNITFNVNDQDPHFPAGIGKTIQFNINPVNDAPYFNPSLTDKSINENKIFNYAITAEDEESNWPLTFNLSVNPNLDLIINETSNTTAIIMFEGNRSSNYFESGNYSINITVYDNLGANYTEIFNLTIVQVNQAPILKYIPTQNGTQGQSFIFYVYANDTDTDVLNFSVDTVPGSCSLTNLWNITTMDGNNTNATGLINVSNLTNNNIICRNIRITVDDGQGEEDSQDVFLNLTNINDAPVMYNISYHSENNGGNDINNLTAYTESTFSYKINVSDIDSLTYEGEQLNYSDNSSLFNIDSNGLIEIMFNQSQIRNYTFLINVSDDGGLSDSKIMYLQVMNNSAPVLNFIGNKSCSEDINCFFIINATDNDGGNLSFTTNNTFILDFTNNISQNPVISAYLNQTYNQSYVGTHQILVEVTDIRGAKDNETIWLTINNTNDAPLIQSFDFPKIVETHLVNFYVYADDEDYDLPSMYANININGTNATNVTEYVTFNITNITGKSLFSINTLFNDSSNQTYTQITFTPGLNDYGNYTVNITAVDYNGVVDSILKNFTVLDKENPPVITQIRPYGKPYINYTNFSFVNTNVFYDNITSINFTENRTVLYNLTVTDNHTAQENLTYEWYIDGNLEGNEDYLSIDYNLFSQGQDNIIVIVENEVYETAVWTWNVTVNNINIAPILVNDLIDLNGDNEITAATTFINYLKNYPDTKFIDPDDDLNENNEIDGDEISRLTYVVDSCSVATITINNHSITVSPISIGTCNVSFRATDSDNEIVWSNSILINVTDTDEEENTVYVTTTRTKTREIEVEVKEEVPKAIEVIIPDIILTNEGEEAEIPIILRNNWNKNINGIYMSGSVNVSSLEIEFSQEYFEYITVHEDVTLTALVKGKFENGEYEVIIGANVSSPDTSDYAVVLIKSGEEGLGDKDLRKNIIFAQDLLSSNPECLELNEILKTAQRQLDNGSIAEATKTIEGVINGCQYLIALSEKEKEQPEKLLSKYINENLTKYIQIFVGLILLSVVTVVVMRKVKKYRMKKEREALDREEDEED